jgi:EpsD family peptidyl-prolyl cis-trans isomerase
MTRHALLIFVSSLCLVLAACSKKEDVKANTQVAARVNSTDITVHQINHALARSRGITPENVPQAKREILDRLVDQELAKRQAILKGLDRSPRVILDMEAAKGEILARAYRDSLLDYLPKPAPYDIKAYYRNHPELFAERRIFNLEELVFSGNEEIAAGVRDRLAKARSLKEIAEWLQSQGIAVTGNRRVRAAEQVALEMLPKLQRMKHGESQLFSVGTAQFRLIRVVGSQAAPIDEAAAAPRIEQFLFNRNAAEVVAKEMKELRTTARIEYFGDLRGQAAQPEGKIAAEREGLPTPENPLNEKN